MWNPVPVNQSARCPIENSNKKPREICEKNQQILPLNWKSKCVPNPWFKPIGMQATAPSLFCGRAMCLKFLSPLLTHLFFLLSTLTVIHYNAPNNLLVVFIRGYFQFKYVYFGGYIFYADYMRQSVKGRCIA